MPTRFLISVIALLLLVVFPSVAQLYTEWLWFGETGYQSIFLKSLATRGFLGVGVFAVAFGILFVNLRLALRGLQHPYVVFPGGGDIQPIVLQQRHVRWLAAGAAALAALFISGVASRQWLVVLNYLNATPFGEADPLFARDASFYIFSLPFFDSVRYLLLAIGVLSLIGSGTAYVMVGQLGLTPQGLRFDSRPVQHLAALIALIFLLLAAGAYLDMPRILTTVSYTHLTLPTSDLV